MANRGGEGRKDGRTDGQTDGQTDGRLEITPCVLQDIGPLGPLPKKDFVLCDKLSTSVLEVVPVFCYFYSIRIHRGNFCILGQWLKKGLCFVTRYGYLNESSFLSFAS